jgi:hypothetical protein
VPGAAARSRHGRTLTYRTPRPSVPDSVTPRAQPWRSAPRYRLADSACIALLAVATTVAGAGMPATFGRASQDARDSGADGSARGWHLVATTHAGPPGNASGYSAVVAPGKDDAWVFGGTNPGAAGMPLVAHWNGSGWHRSRLPAGLGSFIGAASASAAANVWAVSYLGGYALRWNGHSWSVARRWRPAARATAVTAISRTDVWVFGAAGIGERGIGTWHYNGHGWRQVTGPNTAISQASAVSRHDIWAISTGRHGGVVVRWDGRSWTRVRTGRALAGAQLDDVLAISPQSVWVLALAPRAHQSGGQVLLAHWNGRRWARHAVPERELSGEPLPGRLVSDGHGGVWVSAMTAGPAPAAVLLHLWRSGRWTRESISRGDGNGVSDLALIPGTRSLWGSGGFLTSDGGAAAIWLHGHVRHMRALLRVQQVPWASQPTQRLVQ